MTSHLCTACIDPPREATRFYYSVFFDDTRVLARCDYHSIAIGYWKYRRDCADVEAIINKRLLASTKEML